MAKKPAPKKVSSRDLAGTRIAGKPVTQKQYQGGALLRALMPSIKGTKIAGKPLTPKGYLRGDLARALFPGMNTATGTPKAPAAPAAPTAPPAAPGPAPLPPDAAYDAARAAADQQYATTTSGLAGQRARGLSDYGFSEDATSGALALDPNNPFSKAALLKQNWDRTRRASAQGMGASGQLYSGAFQNQADYVNRGELGAQDTLQKSLGDFLTRNTTAAGQAGVDRSTAYSTAEEGRMGRVNTNPLYDPQATIDTPAAVAAGNTKGSVVTNKLGHKGRWVTRPDGTRYFQRV